jgi:2-oxoglutarate dehydrogenase E1 component
MSLVDSVALTDIENVVFGMAHRGRLEILYSVFQKQPEEIMAEF